MTERDASSDEMPGFTLPGRLRRERDDYVLDMILDGRSLPPDAPRDLQDLAQLLACLADPAEPGSLAGEADARSAFARAVPPVSISPAPGKGVPTDSMPTDGVPADGLATDGVPAAVAARVAAPRRSGPRRVRLAGVLAAVATVLASATAAAYADVLPGPVQEFAHRTIGAPPAPAAPAPPVPTPPGRAHSGGHQADAGEHHGQAGSRAPHGTARHSGRGHSDHPARPGHSGKPGHGGKPGHPPHPAHPVHS